MPNTFEKKESKYFLTKNQYIGLLNLLRDELVEDKYHIYKICNIYYDTDNFDLFRKTIDKPVYKEKLRLRSYGKANNNDIVFLEIKKKFDGIVYKRRINTKLNSAYNLINNPKVKIQDESINAKEIINFLNKYELNPMVYLSYDREAYLWKSDKSLRITFDTNIKYRFDNVGLEYDDYGNNLFDDNKILMEIKSDKNLPIEFCNALCKLKIYPTSFSKIGYVYKTKILKRNGD